MYNFLTKNGQALAFGLGVLITIVFMISIFSGIESYSAMDKETQYETGIFNFGLSGALALAILCAVLLVGFGLFHIATNFKGSLKGIIGFAILIVIFLVAYTTASSDATPFIQGAIDKFEGAGNGIIDGGTLKYISGGISTAVSLVLIAAAAFVISELRNFFK